MNVPLDMCAQRRFRLACTFMQSSLGAFWIANDAKFLHADNENSEKSSLNAHVRTCVFVFRYTLRPVKAQISLGTRTI